MLLLLIAELVEVAWYELLPVASRPCNACLQLETSVVHPIFSLGEMVTSVTYIQHSHYDHTYNRCTSCTLPFKSLGSLRVLYFFPSKDTLNQSNETVIHLNTVLLNVLFKDSWKKTHMKRQTVGFPVAQMVEHGASNAKIMGSIPRESKSW